MKFSGETIRSQTLVKVSNARAICTPQSPLYSKRVAFYRPSQFRDSFCIRLAERLTSLLLFGNQPLSSFDGVIVAYKTFPC